MRIFGIVRHILLEASMGIITRAPNGPDGQRDTHRLRICAYSGTEQRQMIARYAAGVFCDTGH
jgi:hypothetical protein